MAQTGKQFQHGGHKGSHRPGGNHSPAKRGAGQGQSDSEKLEAISAPYNFTPLPDWVYIPHWGKQVSHDLPFQDGFSGEIVYRLVAESPLLVGGTQKAATDATPGEVRPFHTPDGRYAIPGSSLKGMIRAVIEIAAFGRMRMVDDVRYGLRDISGPHVAKSYKEKVRGKITYGLMRQRADGATEIIPCAMVRLDHRELERALGVPAPVFPARASVAEKYRMWEELCRASKWDRDVLRFSPNGEEALNPGMKGAATGVPVFTGQISDSTKAKGKRRDFVFFNPREKDAFAIEDEVWRDFLFIHGNDKTGTVANSMSWPGHWRAIYRQGGTVPVFYLRDGSKSRIGLAYMPKLAGDFSIHEMIRHSAEAHLDVPGREHGYDLADLLFGAVGEEPADALRGRVSFELAPAQGKPQPVQQGNTILNGPKPTFFPNYVTQKANKKSWELETSQYATYIETQEHPRPTVRGFKRYPARPEDKIGVQSLTNEQKVNKKVQVQLHTLPTGTSFTGRIVFHNLKPEELGALLWALTWGGNEKLRHGLGMGKPFGFGQVRFEIGHGESRLCPNDPVRPEMVLDHARVGELVGTFTGHMEKCAEARGRGPSTWAECLQIANLLAMADADAAKCFPAELRHMRLEVKAKVNEFRDAKQDGLVLADYAAATGRITSGARSSRGSEAGSFVGGPPSHAAPVGVAKELWSGVVLNWNPGPQILTARKQKESAIADQTVSAALLSALPEVECEALRRNKKLAGVTVEVERQGNSLKLVAVHTRKPSV